MELPADFCVQSYKKYNPDICILPDHFAKIHYCTIGHKELRPYKLVLPEGFDWEVYRDLNPDLQYNTKQALETHYVAYGIHEQRQYKDVFFDRDYFAKANNITEKDNIYKRYLQDVRLIKSQTVKDIVDNIPNLTKDFVLVSHNSKINGASHSLYILANFLKSQNKDVIIIDTHANEEVYEKYNLTSNDFRFYYEDPTILYWLCNKIQSKKIIVNSINNSISEVIKWVNRDRLLLFSRETKANYTKRSCYEPDVVITEAISVSYDSKPVVQTPICPMFLQNRIYLNYEDPVDIPNLDKKKITIGMCGNLSKRKNFHLFLEIARELPQYNFIWIGGDNLNSSTENVYHIKDTPNPFKYYKLFDYFVLFSECEPFGNVVIENLLLNKKVLTFKENVWFDFKHKLTKNNYYEFDGPINIENAVTHILNVATEKQNNLSYWNSSSNLYVREKFSEYNSNFLSLLQTKTNHLNKVKNITDTRNITVSCPMGFGNQLRLMLAGSFLVTNNFIESYTQEWILNDHNNVSYLSWFMELPGVKLNSLQAKNVSYNNIINTTTFTKMIEFFTNKKVTPAEAFGSVASALMLKPDVQQHFEEFAYKNNISDALGLHIRGTDKSELYGTKFAFNSIKHLTNQYDKVFLATDDKLMQELIANEINSKLIVYQQINNNNARRNTTERHTVADFVLLQRCKTFVGSDKSSFSTLIKQLRNNSNDLDFVYNL